jgi:hypothetical protein
MHVSQPKGRETAKEPLKTTGFQRFPSNIKGGTKFTKRFDPYSEHFRIFCEGVRKICKGNRKICKNNCIFKKNQPLLGGGILTNLPLERCKEGVFYVKRLRPSGEKNGKEENFNGNAGTCVGIRDDRCRVR